MRGIARVVGTGIGRFTFMQRLKKTKLEYILDLSSTKKESDF